MFAFIDLHYCLVSNNTEWLLVGDCLQGDSTTVVPVVVSVVH